MRKKGFTLRCICVSMFIFLFVSCIATNKSSLTSENDSGELASLAPDLPFQDQTLDGILVTIGEDSILLSDLQRTVMAASNGQAQLMPDGQLTGQVLSPSQVNHLLENLIDQKILQVKAVALGITVSNEELSRRIDEFLSRQGLDTRSLEQQLTENGLTFAEYREQFKTEIIKQQLIGRVIAPLVTVTDDEVQNFYLQKTGEVQQVSSVKLRSLVVNVSDSDSQTSILQDSRVVEISRKISEGEDFIQLVKQYSTATDAVNTEGLLPPRSFASLPNQLQESLAKMSVGEITSPIVIGNSVFFFQYLGVIFDRESDLRKSFSSWKAKLEEMKFNEQLNVYLYKARKEFKVNKKTFLIR